MCGRRRVWSIFNDPPDDNWGGLRGDVYMWNLIRSACWNYDSITAVEFKKLVSSIYGVATGHALEGDGEDFVQLFFDVGYGMSKGYVSRKWWIRKGLPSLQERLLRYNSAESYDRNAKWHDEEERAVVKWVVSDASKKFGINDCYFCDNFTVAPYVVNKLVIPIDNDSEVVENVGNSIFHRLGLLPLTKSIAIGEHSRYCLIEQYEDVYLVVFNEPSAVRDGYPFPRIILQNYRVGGRLTKELKAYASLMRRCNG